MEGWKEDFKFSCDYAFCMREGVWLSQLKGSVLQQLQFFMDGPENGFIEQEADVIVYFDEK